MLIKDRAKRIVFCQTNLSGNHLKALTILVDRCHDIYPRARFHQDLQSELRITEVERKNIISDLENLKLLRPDEEKNRRPAGYKPLPDAWVVLGRENVVY